VLPDIDQCLLDDSEYLAADSLAHIEFFKVRNKPGSDSSLSLKAFDSIPQHPEQTLRVYVDGFHLLHELSQFEDFLSEQLLDASQLPVNGLIRLCLPPQHIYLHFYSNERLYGSIVQFAGKARTLGRRGSPAQAMQKINVVNGRSYLSNQVQKESQFLLPFAAPRGIEQKNAATPLTTK
jgi:hypothetical protein